MSKTYKDSRYRPNEKHRSDRHVYYDRKNRRQFRDLWKQVDWEYEEELEEEWETDYER